MTRTSRLGTLAMVLLVSMLVGTLAVVLMDGGTGFPTASASVAQNANKSTGYKKPETKPKTDCSKSDDAALAAQIRDRLSKHALLKDEKEINVDVKARVATLTGKAKVKSHRLTAAAEAKKVACIKNVVNFVCGKCSESDPFCCRGFCQSTPCEEKPKSTKPKSSKPK